MRSRRLRKAADVVGVPGGQARGWSGWRTRSGAALLGGAEAGVGLVGLAAGRGLFLVRGPPPLVRPRARARLVSAWSGTARTANSEPTVASTSTPVSTPPSTAITGLRRAHRQYRSTALTWRARIGSSARNRPRSSPIASADWYRAFGSLSIAFKTIVSRSRGIRASMDRGLVGSSVLICSISLSRSGESNPGRSVSSS